MIMFLNAITDIVIANKSSKEIDHVLVENNVPYFSFCIWYNRYT